MRGHMGHVILFIMLWMKPQYVPIQMKATKQYGDVYLQYFEGYF